MKLSMHPVALLTLVTGLGCKPPPEAPRELSELSSFLFRLFETEDEDLLALGMENLEALFAETDLSGGFKSRSYTPAQLGEEDLEGLTRPDRDPSACLPVAVVTPSGFTPAEHTGVMILSDQTPVEPGSPERYDRTFLEPEDKQCFSGGDCLRLVTMNDIHKKNLFMEVEYLMHKDFRWVGQGVLARTWIEEEAWDEDGDAAIHQSYSIDVFLPAAGGGVRYMSLWSESTAPGGFGDDVVSSTIAYGIDDIFKATEGWLEDQDE